MGLHAISDDGTLHWKCLGQHTKCQNPITVHITHEGVQWHLHGDEYVVKMPICPKCGSQMIVRVTFSEEELQANNAQQYGMVPQQMTVPHALTGEQIPVMIPALMPVGANPFFARHQKLAELMDIHGKQKPAIPDETIINTAPPPTIEETVARLLQEYGVITSPRLPAVNPPNETTNI